jgi:hypothetical protein
MNQAKVYPRTTHLLDKAGSYEWYTPSEVISLVHKVLGGIDLDPASSDIANKTVKAESIYTLSDNGLNQSWFGRVYLNPPYSAKLIGQFIDKLICHISLGDVTEAIVLTNNGTETKWGQILLANCDAMCFPSHRIRFLSPEGLKAGPLQGQMITYIGNNVEVFESIFSAIGVVTNPYCAGEGKTLCTECDPEENNCYFSNEPYDAHQSALDDLTCTSFGGLFLHSILARRRMKDVYQIGSKQLR